VVDPLDNDWINPFVLGDDDILSVSTGCKASPEVKRDLLTAREKEETTYQQFVDMRLSKCIDFFQPIQKQKLKAFSCDQVVKKTTADPNMVVLRADHHLFGRMLLIAASRKLDMK
jgi:hypothetical protein